MSANTAEKIVTELLLVCCAVCKLSIHTKHTIVQCKHFTIYVTYLQSVNESLITNSLTQPQHLLTTLRQSTHTSPTWQMV